MDIVSIEDAPLPTIDGIRRAIEAITVNGQQVFHNVALHEKYAEYTVDIHVELVKSVAFDLDMTKGLAQRLIAGSLEGMLPIGLQHTVSVHIVKE